MNRLTALSLKAAALAAPIWLGAALIARLTTV